MIKKGAGYTIVELMVVVTVTSVIALSAFTMIQGQQSRTQYSQAMRDIELKLVDIANDVNSGYYPSFSSGSCDASNPTTLTFSSIGDGQGASSGCTFIGKAVHFAPDASSPEDHTKMNIYTLAGRRVNASNQTVLSLNEATPAAVADPALDITEAEDTIYQLRFDTSSPNTGVLVFLTGFGTQSPSQDLVGNPTTDIYYLSGTSIGASKASVIAALKVPANYQKVPPGGLKFCMKYDDTNGRITLGENSRRFEVKTELDVASC